jgi:hypothetical protein
LDDVNKVHIDTVFALWVWDEFHRSENPATQPHSVIRELSGGPPGIVLSATPMAQCGDIASICISAVRYFEQSNNPSSGKEKSTSKPAEWNLRANDAGAGKLK